MRALNERHVLDRPFTILLSYDAATRSWLAHCLEFDMVEEGKSQRGALLRLFKIMKANVKDALQHDTVRDLFQFAPKEYWIQALAARPLSLEAVMTSKQVVPYDIPPAKLDLKLLSPDA